MSGKEVVINHKVEKRRAGPMGRTTGLELKPGGGKADPRWTEPPGAPPHKTDSMMQKSLEVPKINTLSAWFIKKPHRHVATSATVGSHRFLIATPCPRAPWSTVPGFDVSPGRQGELCDVLVPIAITPHMSFRYWKEMIPGYG